MKSVVYILPALGISGGVAVVLQHANRLSRRGWDVSIETMDPNSDVSWFPENNVSIYHSSKIEKGAYRDIAIATHFSTVQELEKYQTLKKMYFVQSDERRFDLKNFDEYSLCEKTYSLDGVEYMTEALWIQRWLFEEFGKTSHYVPNGLDEKLFFASKPIIPKTKKLRVLIEGSIDFRYKGVREAYESIRGLDLEVWMVSNCGYPEKDWKIDNFFDKVPLAKMKDIYSSCDVLVKMSRVEGFFGPPLEAMACGCAVVTGKVTGYDEYIKDGFNALVVEQGDMAGARKHILKLMDDRSLLQHMRKNGFETAKEWNWERSLKYLENAFHARVPQLYYDENYPEKYDFAVSVRKILENMVMQKEREIQIFKSELLVARESEMRLLREVDFLKSSKFWKARSIWMRLFR